MPAAAVLSVGAHSPERYIIEPFGKPGGSSAHGDLVATPAETVVPVWYWRLGEPLPTDLILKRPEIFQRGYATLRSCIKALVKSCFESGSFGRGAPVGLAEVCGIQERRQHGQQDSDEELADGRAAGCRHDDGEQGPASCQDRQHDSPFLIEPS